MAFKTPGVYVEEKSIFPPSIAQVETAIPAFIGYTEKAEEKTPEDLRKKPKKISSMLEFETYFGGPPPLSISKVELDSNNSFKSATISPRFYLYHSMQLFFANGGGDCYIVSVGSYSDGGVAKERFSEGLQALEKEDEPTLIVFPDAVLLGDDDFYNLQKEALKQCGELKDRFAILDLKEYDSTSDFDTQVEKFRDGIGTSNLKYGAAYTPFLKTSLEKDVRYKDIKGKIERSGMSINLLSLDTSSSSQVQDLIKALDKYVDDSGLISDAMAKLIERLKSKFSPQEYDNLEGWFDALDDTLATNATKDNFRNMLTLFYEIILMADKLIYGNGNYGTGASDTNRVAVSNISDDFKDAAKNDIFEDLKEIVKSLMQLEAGAKTALTGYGDYVSKSYKTEIAQVSDYNAYDWKPGDVPDTEKTTLTGDDDTKKILGTRSLLTGIFERLQKVATSLSDVNDTLMRQKEDSLKEQFPIYKNLIEEIGKELSTLPPSGAIAGVYAQVDRDRGVWKAPANVSLNGVSGLAYHFKQTETDSLNVDVNFGKSINAIRFMTGMGFMVWGARTLAGNDNEWRYISVRRFFNMVEESCKKSTMWAVFEPNDASTWIKVKTMIENFLLLQWRNGALQGAKPDEAFFVKVGLGETMTPQDILEGRMNVEIGMAVVRPAEFIILTFSHKLVGS